MPRMNPMEAVVRVLEDEGVTHAFGVPGAAILPLYDAMRHSDIRHLSVRHEEGGTHAADGWARITGEPGICIGTSGPAGTNMITGLYTALADSIPIICITGQANRNVLHKEAFQAVDIVDIARPVCKWAYQVKETAQLPWAFREAFRVAREGRPGPVLIDLPLDVQKGEDIEYDPATDGRLAYITPEPNANAIAAALDMLAAAERPLILAGGGVILANASEELVGFAEDLGIPVSPTYMGKGSIPEDHPLWAGIVGIQTTPALRQSDLPRERCRARRRRALRRPPHGRHQRLSRRPQVHPHRHRARADRARVPADLGIVSDAKLALQALREQAAQRTERVARGLDRARHATSGRR